MPNAQTGPDNAAEQLKSISEPPNEACSHFVVSVHSDLV